MQMANTRTHCWQVHTIRIEMAAGLVLVLVTLMVLKRQRPSMQCIWSVVVAVCVGRMANAPARRNGRVLLATFVQAAVRQS